MRRIIIAITGASGVIYGIRALQILAEIDDVKTHAVITRSAYRTALSEVDLNGEQLRSLADYVHSNDDIGASISSGSFIFVSMRRAPSSTLSPCTTPIRSWDAPGHRAAAGNYLENGRISAKLAVEGLKPETKVDPDGSKTSGD